jgi:transposase
MHKNPLKSIGINCKLTEKTKYIKGLSDSERQTLLDASRYAPLARFRQWAHAVYLSGKGYKLGKLADIFEVDRDTVSGWLDAWEQCGLMGLRDQERPGRPRKGTATERDRLCAAAKESPHQIRGLPAQFQERTGQSLSKDTVRLKEKGLAWKRCRRSLKGQRDEAGFLEGKRVLAALHEREKAGEIEVFYLDESGFSARKEYRKRNASGAVCDDPRIAVGPGVLTEL